jgi:hypothetical protein
LVTDDKTGTKLPPPPHSQSWVFEREIDLDPSRPSGIGGSPEEILAVIEEKGYFQWP